MGMYQFPRAAVTNHHTLGGFKKQVYFLTVLRIEGQNQCVIKPSPSSHLFPVSGGGQQSPTASL